MINAGLGLRRGSAEENRRCYRKGLKSEEKERWVGGKGAERRQSIMTKEEWMTTRVSAKLGTGVRGGKRCRVLAPGLSEVSVALPGLCPGTPG